MYSILLASNLAVLLLHVRPHRDSAADVFAEPSVSLPNIIPHPWILIIIKVVINQLSHLAGSNH
jgi:hypothetical protein